MVVATLPSKVAVPAPGVWFFDTFGGHRVHEDIIIVIDRCRPGGPSVLECVVDDASGRVTIYDCAVAAGSDVRHFCLTRRMEIAGTIARNWTMCRPSREGEEPAVPDIARYTDAHPCDLKGAKVVLFVRDAAPLAQFAGGDAFVWKEPTLADGQHVLICRGGDCMASADPSCVLLRSVGTHEDPDNKIGHMSAQVCAPRTGNGDGRVWEVIRPARGSERLSTCDECTSPEYVHTQITRSGMMRLLDQISATHQQHRALPASRPQSSTREARPKRPDAAPGRCNVGTAAGSPRATKPKDAIKYNK
jgi:hypothetical protein